MKKPIKSKTLKPPKSDFWNTVKKEQKKFESASTGTYKPFKRKNKGYKTSSGTKKFEELTGEEQFKVLSARANKRLQRLEKYSKRDEYKGLEKAAYSKAVYDIEAIRGEGKSRFSREMPQDTDEANAQLNAMIKFLRADTSTLQAGISTAGANISRYEEMARKFNEGYTDENGNYHKGFVDAYGGEQLTWREITTWYSSYNGKLVARRYKSSDAVAIALGQFKKLLKDKDYKNLTVDQWKQEFEKNPEKLSGGDFSAESAMRFMLDSGIQPANMFNKRK